MVLTALAALVVLLPASAASAVTVATGERIRSYDVVMALQADGSARIKETIQYDFAGMPDKHGIYRTLPTSVPYDDTHDRSYPVSDVEVSSPTGAPADVEEQSSGGVLTLRIGDANTEVEGVQTYVISYDVGGTINNFSDHQELYWNLVGTYWEVPIEKVTATVTAPAAATKADCFEGAQGATQPCTVGRPADAVAFAGAGLQAREGLTGVIAYPVGTFPNYAPIIKERQTLARAFSLNPVSVGGGGLTLAVFAGGAAMLVSRRGRDEKYLGVIPGLEPGLGQEHVTQRVGVFGRDPIAVQFHPPDGMRAGVVGTLLDERADVIDVTATIIDLAVRGYLRIEEIEKQGFFGKTDWRLVATPPPAGVGGLADYEQKLLRSIFENRDSVLHSDLKTTFSSDLSAVQDWLYKEVVSRGWFRSNPQTVRVTWTVLGVVLLAAGIGLTVLLALSTRFALIGLGVAVGGLVLLACASRMPARTASGTAALAQANGFRRYLETAEANQIRFEEGQDLFSRYLPYAIVFGVAERWAKVFADLAASGVAVSAPSWYVGNYAMGGAFNMMAFGGAVDSFSTVAAGSLSAPTPSSSGGSGFGGGGFSGGGGGGGGGGSW